jgi:hypothetical protein
MDLIKPLAVDEREGDDDDNDVDIVVFSAYSFAISTYRAMQVIRSLVLREPIEELHLNIILKI